MNLSPGHNGYLHLILGPMFSGKSTTLLRQFRRFKVSKKSCLLIKYHGDQRYTDRNYIATHDKVISQEEAFPCHHLSDLEHQQGLDLNAYDVFCLDEVQFYPDKLEFCLKWRARGKIIVGSGLYSDFKRNPFPQLPELIAHSDKVEFLKAICPDCLQDKATTSYRLSNEVDQVVIGGSEKYLPLCHGCYELRHSLMKPKEAT